MNQFSVILLLTEKCNLRCSYCYEQFDYKSSNQQQLDRIKNFFSVLSRKYDTINVSFFGGEPMLAIRQIRDVMSHNATLDARFHYSMTSNGVLLSLELLQELIDHDLVQVQLTLDGWKGSHDATRRRKGGLSGTFDTIYDRLLSYRKAKGDFAGIIRVNASPANAADIETLAQNLVRDFRDDGRFLTFIRPVGKWGGSNDDDLAVLDQLKYGQLEHLFYSIVPESMHGKVDTEVCYAAKPNQLLVYPDGRLGKCTVGLHDELNDIGRIEDDGSIQVDSVKFSYWSRGLRTGDASQQACPYWAAAE